MVNALREELVAKGNSLEEVKKAVKEVSTFSTINLFYKSTPFFHGHYTHITRALIGYVTLF